VTRGNLCAARRGAGGVTTVLELTGNAAGQVLEAGPFPARWTLGWLAVLCAAGAALLGSGWLGGLAAGALLLSLKIR